MEPNRFQKSCDCCSKIILIAQKWDSFPPMFFPSKPTSGVKLTEVSVASKAAAGRQGHLPLEESFLSCVSHPTSFSHPPACCLSRKLVLSCSVHQTILFCNREGIGSWDLQAYLSQSLKEEAEQKKKKERRKKENGPPSPFHFVIFFLSDCKATSERQPVFPVKDFLSSDAFHV